MSDALDLYRRIADGFEAALVAAPPDAWDNPSPCPGWSASYLPTHVVGVARTYLAVADTGAVPDGLEAYIADMAARGQAATDSAGSGIAAFRALRAEVEERLADPERAGAMVQTPFGELPLAAVAAYVMGGDMLAHTWDFARAVGGNETLDAEAATAVLGVWTPLDAGLRSPGVCGPRIDLPVDSDAGSRFVAFTGRQP